MLIENKEKYIPSLMSLWEKVFGDSEEYIRLFFEKAYYTSECFAEIIDNQAVSAFYLLSCNIRFEGKIYKGRYLYAAATLPSYRGKGIMAALIKEAQEYAKKQKLDFIALVPASDSLYDFYARFGFYEAMYKYAFSPEIKNGSAEALREITDPSELHKIRSSAPGNILVYDRSINEYAFSCLLFSGNKVLALDKAGYFIDGEELLLASEPEDTAVYFGNLPFKEAEQFGNIRPEGAEKIRNGMLYCPVKGLELKDIYMNIALD